jgi:hypothetical protein
MKKIAALLMLGSTLYMANAGDIGVTNEGPAPIYVGADVIYGFNNISKEYNNDTQHTTDNSIGFDLKVGFLLDSGFRIEGSYMYQNYNDPIFDKSHTGLNELGLDVIKTFDMTPEFYPFIQAGIGYGWMSVNDLSQSYIGNFTIGAGGGMIYRASKKVELLIGLELAARAWQDIDDNTLGTLQTGQVSANLYAGFNILF